MVTVSWQSRSATHAQVWRVLDLSGLTNNVRQSYGYTKSGWVYLNNSIVDLRTTVEVGAYFTLEIRFPNGRIRSKYIFLTSKQPRGQVRSNEPTTLHRRG